MSPDPTMSPGERRRVAYLLRRIYAIFRDPATDWRVVYLKTWGSEHTCRKHGVSPRTVGFVDDERELIMIDPRHDVLGTFVHECMHIIYEDAPEDRVVELETFIVERMSARQATHLHLLMAHHLV